jgi:hypothetical protein
MLTFDAVVVVVVVVVVLLLLNVEHQRQIATMWDTNRRRT